ncbi:MAG: hypothetical protein IKU72_02060 [Oscillospiraceae bacterium]|nr:hypothetical protein [Oscillospiraceae bacterium]
MIRGTTPTHRFALPVGMENIKEVRVTYAQKGRPVLTKKNNDCSVEGRNLSVRLSQTDTFLFDPGHEVEIQLRILTPTGDALASEIIRTTVERCLENEVMA